MLHNDPIGRFEPEVSPVVCDSIDNSSCVEDTWAKAHDMTKFMDCSCFRFCTISDGQINAVATKIVVSIKIPFECFASTFKLFFCYADIHI